MRMHLIHIKSTQIDPFEGLNDHFDVQMLTKLLKFNNWILQFHQVCI